MNKFLITACSALLAAGLSQGALASYQGVQGFFIGIGPTSTGSSDCGSDCDTSGVVFEAGYDVNRLVGIEFKLYDTEADDFNDKLRIHYTGANLGHDFDTHWFRLYGKLGVATINEWAPGIYRDSETKLALGMGVRFTPVGVQRGTYIKLEVLGTEFLNQDLGMASLSFGYKF